MFLLVSLGKVSRDSLAEVGGPTVRRVHQGSADLPGANCSRGVTWAVR